MAEALSRFLRRFALYQVILLQLQLVVQRVTQA